VKVILIKGITQNNSLLEGMKISKLKTVNVVLCSDSSNGSDIRKEEDYFPQCFDDDRYRSVFILKVPATPMQHVNI
jgi:hypothetical protein